MIPEIAPTRRPTLRLLRLRSSHFDTHREIRGRNAFWHAREQHGQLAEPL